MPLDALAAIAIAKPPAAVVAPGQVVDWNSGPAEHKARAFRSGPYVLRLSVASTGELPDTPPGVIGAFGRVTISGPDPQAQLPVLTLTSQENAVSSAYLRVAVARLDPASPIYSVLMTSFTGGAHCCDDVQIATPSPTAAPSAAGPPGWSVLHPGAFDGAQLGFGPKGARLPQGADGTFGLSIPDDRFDYVYGCFACSYAPIRIFGLRDGALVDRTAEPAFRPLLEADMRRSEVACRQGEAGVCPGYLADATRLGRWAEGWRVLKASIKGKPQWAYPDRLCDGVEVRTKCRPGQRAQPIPDYATSVRLFLTWRGYPVPAAG